MKIITKSSHPLYEGFTLTELLVVMIIFSVLTAISVATFSSLRTNILLSEESQNVSQLIRKTQRSSLLLERKVDEKWLYGIGLDFSTTHVDNKYKVFKWCSTFNYYGDLLTSGNFPNFDPGDPLGPTNGNIPSPVTDSDAYVLSCNKSAILPSDGGLSKQAAEFTNIQDPLIIGFKGTFNTRPVLILFESVSGRVFFYNKDGLLLNYNSDGTPVSSPTDFEMVLAPPNKSRGTLVKIHHSSGKLSTEILEASQVNDYEFN
ncbi:type II secretion system protein [Candidatus Nomurabacteria bacterium]|nr:type II secretion system protein [Candidatus Nomurabacteria bacterium]